MVITNSDIGVIINSILECQEIKTILEERESAAEDEKRRIERLFENN